MKNKGSKNKHTIISNIRLLIQNNLFAYKFREFFIINLYFKLKKIQDHFEIMFQL